MFRGFLAEFQPQFGIVRTTIKAQFLKRGHRQFNSFQNPIHQKDPNQDFDVAFGVVIRQESDHET